MGKGYLTNKEHFFLWHILGSVAYWLVMHFHLYHRNSIISRVKTKVETEQDIHYEAQWYNDFTPMITGREVFQEKNKCMLMNILYNFRAPW